jgi:multidrug efflux pump subunit AcrB
MMLRKLITVALIVVVAVAGVGCKKTPAQKTEVKSQAEYDTKAKKDITSENMQAELDKVEKEIQQENKGP